MRLLAALLLCLPVTAWAGAQQYERLTEPMRQRLAAWAGDRPVAQLLFKNPADGQRWIAEMDQRLEKRIPDRKQRLELLRTVHFEAVRAGLDPQLVLGVIEIESGFRKYAVSKAGARGFMQVMPFWVKQIGQPGNNLFNERTNLRYGCTILRHYLDRDNGNLMKALGRYNGSLGQKEYPTRVLRALKERWSLAAA